jgi:hypothetical protein
VAGSTANPLEGPSDGFSYSMAESSLPAATEVETELRRLARQRLMPPEGEVAMGKHRISRSFRHRHQPLEGAFDSPRGFAFESGGMSRRD